MYFTTLNAFMPPSTMIDDRTPSMVLLCSAGTTSLKSIGTPVAPMAFMISISTLLAMMRSFLPLTSLSRRIGSSDAIQVGIDAIGRVPRIVPLQHDTGPIIAGVRAQGDAKFFVDAMLLRGRWS